jgi:hypothetical protein
MFNLRRDGRSGRRTFEPTAEQRNNVKILVSLGLPPKHPLSAGEQPADRQPLDEKSLREHFAHDRAEDPRGTPNEMERIERQRYGGSESLTCSHGRGRWLRNSNIVVTAIRGNAGQANYYAATNRNDAGNTGISTQVSQGHGADAAHGPTVGGGGSRAISRM